MNENEFVFERISFLTILNHSDTEVAMNEKKFVFKRIFFFFSNGTAIFEKVEAEMAPFPFLISNA